MHIIIWSFYAVLIGQAVCLPGWEFGITNEDNPGVSQQVIDDLIKLMSQEGISKDDEKTKKLITGLMSGNLENADEQFKNSNRLPPPLPGSVPESPTIDPNVPDPGQSLQEDPPHNPHGEIKSLAEWVKIDRMQGPSGLQKMPENPLIEDTVQKPPGTLDDLQARIHGDLAAEPSVAEKDHSVKNDQELESTVSNGLPVAEKVAEDSMWNFDRHPVLGLGSYKPAFKSTNPNGPPVAEKVTDDSISDFDRHPVLGFGRYNPTLKSTDLNGPPIDEKMTGNSASDVDRSPVPVFGHYRSMYNNASSGNSQPTETDMQQEPAKEPEKEEGGILSWLPNLGQYFPNPFGSGTLF